MTEQTQPTDAEILDTADDFRSQYKHGGTTFDEFDALGFARAVLAKWGTPAGAGEPIGYINRGMAPHTEGKVIFHEKPTENLEGRWWTPDQSVFAAPQPTQAQAGAVPLTVEQLYEERQTAIPQLFDLAQQWADNKIHSYQFANEAEKIVDAVARRVESAHGITAHGVADMKGDGEC